MPLKGPTVCRKSASQFWRKQPTASRRAFSGARAKGKHEGSEAVAGTL